MRLAGRRAAVIGVGKGAAQGRHNAASGRRDHERIAVQKDKCRVGVDLTQLLESKRVMR